MEYGCDGVHGGPLDTQWSSVDTKRIVLDPVDPREGAWRLPEGQRKEVKEWDRNVVMCDVMVSTRMPLELHWLPVDIYVIAVDTLDPIYPLESTCDMLFTRIPLQGTRA